MLYCSSSKSERNGAGDASKVSVVLIICNNERERENRETKCKIWGILDVRLKEKFVKHGFEDTSVLISLFNRSHQQY